MCVLILHQLSMKKSGNFRAQSFLKFFSQKFKRKCKMQMPNTQGENVRNLKSNEIILNVSVEGSSHGRVSIISSITECWEIEEGVNI